MKDSLLGKIAASRSREPGFPLSHRDKGSPVDHRKPLVALRPAYDRLADSLQQLSEAPEVYIETLPRDLADVLRDFPALPEQVTTAVTDAIQPAEAKDVHGARKMVKRAMAACRKWDGEDPDVVLDARDA